LLNGGKTKLATANRSRVSICVTKIFATAGGVVDRYKFFSNIWSSSTQNVVAV